MTHIFLPSFSFPVSILEFLPVPAVIFLCQGFQSSFDLLCYFMHMWQGKSLRDALVTPTIKVKQNYIVKLITLSLPLPPQKTK